MFSLSDNRYDNNLFLFNALTQCITLEGLHYNSTIKKYNSCSYCVHVRTLSESVNILVNQKDGMQCEQT